MDPLHHLIRVSLPNYFRDLPIPDTFGGWFSLGIGDWLRLIPFGVTVGGLSYLSLQGLVNSPVIGPAIKASIVVELTMKIFFFLQK